MSLFKERLEKLRAQLKSHQAFLLLNPSDIFYLTGFNFLVPEEREAFLIISQKTTLLLHASFSPYQMQTGIRAIKNCNLNKLNENLQQLQLQENISEVFTDKTNLFVNEYESLQKLSKLKLLGFDRDLIWELRLVKDQAELKKLQAAASMTAQVMEEVLAELKAGLLSGKTEEEIRDLIEVKLKQAGSTQPAFPTIVAFGENSARPHHQPTPKKLTPESAVLLDFGATVAHYRGDMTRTIWFGTQVDGEFLQIEKIVQQGYQAALNRLVKNKTPQKASDQHSNQDNKQAQASQKTIFNQLHTKSTKSTKSGSEIVKAKDLDNAARKIITAAGYGEQFIHTTGHGLGIDIHESLSLNWQNEQPILPGMVITIEPGIYLAGKFGYRYENTVTVGKTSAEVLTK